MGPCKEGQPKKEWAGICQNLECLQEWNKTESQKDCVSSLGFLMVEFIYLLEKGYLSLYGIWKAFGCHV